MIRRLRKVRLNVNRSSINCERFAEKPKFLDNWKYTAHNTVLFHPDGAPMTEEEKVALAKRFVELSIGGSSKLECFQESACDQ